MLEREPTRIETLQERQKIRNDRSKYWAAVIGQNMSLAVCLMIPAFLVTMIWTDFTWPTLGVSFGMNTIVTAVLFIWGESSAISVGIPSGKLDSGYEAIQKAFLKRKEEIKAKGILKMGVFCEWQVAEELTAAKKAMCRKLKIDWHTYLDEIAPLDEDALIAKYGKVKGKLYWRINAMEPIELTPEMILGEQQGGQRGGISQSADEYIAQQKYGRWSLVKSILPIVATVGTPFTFAPNVAWGTIVFAIYRLIAVLLRMKVGFDKGAKAYNTVEVKHRESQIYYMDRYDEFLGTQGLYEAAVARYGTTLITPIPTIKEVPAHEVETQYVDRAGGADDQPTREPDARAEPSVCPAPAG